MKNKPQLKKLATVLELDQEELKYLICGVERLANRPIHDEHTDELHERVKSKLETAFNSF